MKTILCVDDEPTQLMLLRLSLSRAGYEVLEASDGQQGVDMAIKHRPALVIMDLMMPVMDGATAIGQLRQNPVTADIPILVLSAYAIGVQSNQAIEAGADEIVPKSLILTELIGLVKQYLD